MSVSKPLDQLANEDLTKLLLRYSLPAVIGMSATSIYHLSAAYFIGRWCGAYAIAGFGLTFPLVNLQMAIGSLFGMGSAASLSIALGKKDHDLAFRILGHCLKVPLIINSILGVLLYLYLPEVLTLFGASDDIYQAAYDFMAPTTLGFPLTSCFISLNHLIRASGYPRKAMQLLLLTVFINIILAPIFIYVLQLDMTGAALATLSAQAIGLLCTIPHLTNKKSTVHFKSGIYRINGEIVRRILLMGMPPCLMNMCGCLVVAAINALLVAHCGSLGPGAYGLINRYCFLYFMIVMGIAQGMQPIVGFNQGVGAYARVRGALYRAMAMGTAVTTVGFIFAQLYPLEIISFFVQDGDPYAQAMVEIGRQGMVLSTLAMFIIGAQSIIGSFFQFIGRPVISVILNLSRQVIILLPCLYILPQLYGANGIWYAITTSDIGAGIACWTALILYLRRTSRKHDISQHL